MLSQALILHNAGEEANAKFFRERLAEWGQKYPDKMQKWKMKQYEKDLQKAEKRLENRKAEAKSTSF